MPFFGKKDSHDFIELIGPKIGTNGAEMKVGPFPTNVRHSGDPCQNRLTMMCVPSLPIPQKGEYVLGDVPTADRDFYVACQLKRDKL